MPLRLFELSDFDIPYGYSPVLLAHPDMLNRENGDNLRAFLRATAKGYKEAMADPAAAAACLPPVSNASDPSLALEGVKALIPHMLHSKHQQWGIMDGVRWTTFTKWLKDQTGPMKDREGQEHEFIVDDLWTNEFLE